MKKVFLFFLLTLLLTASCKNEDNRDTEMNKLKEWRAGERVSQQSVAEFGIENCFVSCTIDDALFKRIYGKSYKEDCTIPTAELRYVKALHFTINGEIQIGEMICNRLICDDLTDIFKNLYQAKYPIERMVLIDNYDANDQLSMVDNNSSGFNFRFISGTTKLSNHSMGLAIDINPLYNPYVKTIDGKPIVDPKKGLSYVDREKDFQYKIDINDLCYKEFTDHGFEWGGSWKSLKDYQHFEKPIQP